MCNNYHLLTNNQQSKTIVPLEVFKALLSGGTKNEATKWETRASAQSAGCLGAHACSPTRGGLSLRESNWKGGHHLVF